jgi:heme-degrading monooxygenase HmoA
LICRMWHGWTATANADAYDAYLKGELFPRLERELTQRGYLGFQVLRVARTIEVEFVTLVWFESLLAVRSFAGEDYEKPVITERARSLLSRYADRVEHYELSGFRWPGGHSGSTENRSV